MLIFHDSVCRTIVRSHFGSLSLSLLFPYDFPSSVFDVLCFLLLLLRFNEEKAVD